MNVQIPSADLATAFRNRLREDANEVLNMAPWLPIGSQPKAQDIANRMRHAADFLDLFLDGEEVTL